MRKKVRFLFAVVILVIGLVAATMFAGTTTSYSTTTRQLIGAVTNSASVTKTVYCRLIPGGGVGNRREELSEETLNVPVIAVGIPTVLDAATIVLEALDVCEVAYNEDDIISKMKLNNFNFIVTPKEIDELIDNMSVIVSEGINQAL